MTFWGFAAIAAGCYALYCIIDKVLDIGFQEKRLEAEHQEAMAKIEAGKGGE